MPSTQIILASGSRYRRQQLEGLGVDFIAKASDIDETPEPGEHPEALVARLALAKASALVPLLELAGLEQRGLKLDGENRALIIGSDQAACVAGAYIDGANIDRANIDGIAGIDAAPILGKPGSVAAAIDQLSDISDKTVNFYTSLCLLDSTSGEFQLGVDVTKVTLRELSRTEIIDYVARDNPLDCAGSFKSEALGIALFESIVTNDPSALIGLPLIMLAKFLANAGAPLLKSA